MTVHLTGGQTSNRRVSGRDVSGVVFEGFTYSVLKRRRTRISQIRLWPVQGPPNRPVRDRFDFYPTWLGLVPYPFVAVVTDGLEVHWVARGLRPTEGTRESRIRKTWTEGVVFLKGGCGRRSEVLRKIVWGPPPSRKGASVCASHCKISVQVANRFRVRYFLSTGRSPPMSLPLFPLSWESFRDTGPQRSVAPNGTRFDPSLRDRRAGRLS